MNIIIYEGYQVKPHNQHPKHYIVVTDGRGGKIPSMLEGMFTTPVLAKAAIDNYLTTKATDGKKSNKTVTEG
jgi:NCAIR mutase (PurE)-related protein